MTGMYWSTLHCVVELPLGLQTEKLTQKTSGGVLWLLTNSADWG